MASHTEGGPVSEADIARFKRWVQNVPAALDAASSDTQPGMSEANAPTPPVKTGEG